MASVYHGGVEKFACFFDVFDCMTALLRFAQNEPDGAPDSVLTSFFQSFRGVNTWLDTEVDEALESIAQAEPSPVGWSGTPAPCALMWVVFHAMGVATRIKQAAGMDLKVKVDESNIQRVVDQWPAVRFALQNEELYDSEEVSARLTWSTLKVARDVDFGEDELSIDVEARTVTLDGKIYAGLDCDSIRILATIHAAGGHFVTSNDLQKVPGLDGSRIDRKLKLLPGPLRKAIGRKPGTGYWSEVARRPKVRKTGATGH